MWQQEGLSLDVPLSESALCKCPLVPAHRQMQVPRVWLLTGSPPHTPGLTAFDFPLLPACLPACPSICHNAAGAPPKPPK